MSLCAWGLSFDKTPSGQYELEKTHAYITFSYTHMGFSNPILRFDQFDVDFVFNRDDIEKSSFTVTIDAASINSGVAVFDDKLRDEKHFFETKEHPTIVFRSQKISQFADSQFEVVGNLIIKGKSRPLTLMLSVNGADVNKFSARPTIGVSATGKLNRSEWGLDYAVPMVSDEVSLRIEVEMQAAESEETPVPKSGE